MTETQRIVGRRPTFQIGGALARVGAALPTVVFGALQDTRNKFPEAVRAGSVELAKRGWFYDLDIPMSDFWDISEWLKVGEIEALDSFFISHYEKVSSGIETKLVEKYANRSEPLRQAFATATQGLYFAAIPILLAQTDGIAVDILGGKFFKSKNKKPEAAKGIENFEESVQKYLAPLQQNAGFNAAEEYKELFPNSPNRHDILHGRDTEYGTKINYLKSLALLSFVGLYIPNVLLDMQVK